MEVISNFCTVDKNDRKTGDSTLKTTFMGRNQAEGSVPQLTTRVNTWEGQMLATCSYRLKFNRPKQTEMVTLKMYDMRPASRTTSLIFHYWWQSWYSVSSVHIKPSFQAHWVWWSVSTVTPTKSGIVWLLFPICVRLKFSVAFFVV